MNNYYKGLLCSVLASGLLFSTIDLANAATDKKEANPTESKKEEKKPTATSDKKKNEEKKKAEAKKKAEEKKKRIEYIANVKKKMEEYTSYKDNVIKYVDQSRELYNQYVNEYNLVKQKIPNEDSNLVHKSDYFDFPVSDSQDYLKSRYLKMLHYVTDNPVEKNDINYHKNLDSFVSNQYKNINKYIKMEKIDKRKVSTSLKTTRDYLISQKKKVETERASFLQPLYAVKELNFLHSELYDGEFKRETSEKEYTKNELEYIKLAINRLNEIDYPNSSFSYYRYEMNVRANEEFLYKTLQRYGKFINDTVSNRWTFYKLPDAERKAFIDAQYLYEESNNNLVYIGITHDQNIGKLKEEKLLTSDLYRSNALDMLHSVYASAMKKTGNFDEFVSLVHHTEYTFDNAYTNVFYWATYFNNVEFNISEIERIFTKQNIQY